VPGLHELCHQSEQAWVNVGQARFQVTQPRLRRDEDPKLLIGRRQPAPEDETVCDGLRKTPEGHDTILDFLLQLAGPKTRRPNPRADARGASLRLC